jgi:hypothetical protein
VPAAAVLANGHANRYVAAVSSRWISTGRVDARMRPSMMSRTALRSMRGAAAKAMPEVVRRVRAAVHCADLLAPCFYVR